LRRCAWRRGLLSEEHIGSGTNWSYQNQILYLLGLLFSHGLFFGMHRCSEDPIDAWQFALWHSRYMRIHLSCLIIHIHSSCSRV
jgi:hypothetical protein